MSDLERAIELLNEGNTCAACNGADTFISKARGVAPLLAWLDEGVDLSRFSVADKVIGKGAAFLYVLLGARTVFASVISEGALDILSSSGVNASFGECVPAIRNRAGTGNCPIESALTGVSSPQDALPIIKTTLENLSKGDKA